MFPSYKAESTLLIDFVNMKDYILSLIYSNLEDEWENEQIEHKYNEIIISTVSKSAPLDIEKNFYSLCHLMEENGSNAPEKYSVIQYYSKLNYISEKIERENAARQ